MNNSLLNFFNLLSPFLAGGFILLCIPFIKTTNENKIVFSPFSFLNFDLYIKSKILIRLLLIICALLLFTIPAFRDYSSLFPSHYDMEVFFDIKGIEKSLTNYTKKEIKLLNLSNNWKNERKHYLEELSNDISKILGISNFFNNGAEYIYSTGTTTFIVEKVEGWQKYHIKEAKGNLSHILELPKINEEKKFHSRFELQNTNNNYINTNIYDIYLKFTKILRPHFKQIASLTLAGDKTIYHHSLIALIKVRFFPINNIGNTIYLVRSKDKASWVPIGYAIYKPIK